MKLAWLYPPDLLIHTGLHTMKKILLMFTLLLTLGACTPMVAQNPGRGFTPVNAITEGEDKHLLLFGHDVVAYFTENTHRLGSPMFKVVYKGVTFRFATAENKALFEAKPLRYLPQYGGFCANGIVYGIPWGGDADTWKIINDRLYIFGGKASRDAFMLDPEKNIQLANQYWSQEVIGNNPLIQRTKRLIFRVPHYRSGSELAAEVAKAQGAK